VWIHAGQHDPCPFSESLGIQACMHTAFPIKCREAVVDLELPM
jgi:hypothetical protein